MQKGIELMNLYWTTSGIFPGEAEISPYDFKDRVEAAAKAGFKGIGIWHTDLEHIMLHRPLKELKTILDDNGIKYVELEFLTDWFLDGSRKNESDSKKKRLLEASQALCAKHIKIGDFYNPPCSMSRIIESFASLCAEAEEYGATIGLEFMQYAAVGTLKDALHVVKTAGAQNGGVILDIVQVENIGIAYADIGHIPPEHLVCVELNDGACAGSPLYDASRARRFCGEGDFDIKGFIQCIQGLGYMGPWAVEVFSKELTTLSLTELNQRAYRSTMAQFSRT